MLDKELELFLLRTEKENYDNGMFEKKKYSKEELAEKRRYFESQLPCERANMTKGRWLYEIKRRFELSTDFDEYPDANFAFLERLIKYGF